MKVFAASRATSSDGSDLNRMSALHEPSTRQYDLQQAAERNVPGDMSHEPVYEQRSAAELFLGILLQPLP